MLHLYDQYSPEISIPIVELRLDLYWDYELNLGINYDWRAEWYYGWDDEDRRIFGELEYELPTSFFLRRYYTGDIPFGQRIAKYDAYITGRTFRAPYDWGYWDILAWNDVKTLDGVQSLHFNEPSNINESITAYTNQSMVRSRYSAPRYQNSFYEPEQLFSACEEGIEINRDLRGFTYDAENNVWVRMLNMMLEPITYIYLPQVILHHNNGRIADFNKLDNGSYSPKNEAPKKEKIKINLNELGYFPCEKYLIEREEELNILESKLDILYKEKNSLESEIIKLPEHPKTLREIKIKKALFDQLEINEKNIKNVRTKIRKAKEA